MLTSKLLALRAALAVALFAFLFTACPRPDGYAVWKPDMNHLKGSDYSCDQVIAEVCSKYAACGMWRAAFHQGRTFNSSGGSTMKCYDMLRSQAAMDKHVALAKKLVEVARPRPTGSSEFANTREVGKSVTGATPGVGIALWKNRARVADFQVVDDDAKTDVV